MTADIDNHVRRLWRHRGTTLPAPRRGPAPQLDLDEIIATAIAIADAEGLTAVSTRAVAARLDRTAMALYPYVGTKENLLALMQDQASAMPQWPDPQTSLADGLLAWSTALFEVYLAHPWLTERPWSQAGQGPNEQDWLERLLGVLARWQVPADRQATAVTMLYATVRATAATTAAYDRMSTDDTDAWLARASAIQAAVPDLAERYPLSTSLRPVTPDWRANPRAAVTAAIHLLAPALTA
ncbi:TetR/AcrR family transcriptional regulator C-terminal domain-containing protein [Asanoa sp. WMMD1127]|uniref:TetR/AcrR family transcriptional regulator n=1 Tax=Asanoa sp. WMMD1127 TaxID=3016107 RepID=UPI00241677EA|nr:TetR/AcrR family transcriptional regulator C-terminal domain-containing protein [Asanoa sp. WMMD1127]MDG4826249.1 TetR/AcrR family transcriptional regulator C-terminal domain-containing protein [Asanoa sp. WMMD1127]